MEKMKEMEEQIMLLLVNAGNARSKAMEAVAAAKKGDYAGAEALLAESNEAMNSAHQQQTGLIQDSLEDGGLTVTLLMTHAEDHMMGAILAKDFAAEIVELYQVLNTLKKEG